MQPAEHWANGAPAAQATLVGDACMYTRPLTTASSWPTIAAGVEQALRERGDLP